MNNKLKILIAALVSILIVIGIFFIMFRFDTDKTETGDVPAWRQFLNFNRDTATENEAENQQESGGKKRLVQVHSEPVSGFTLIEDEKGLKVRFMERATGHIYDFYPENNSRIRISNTTMPQKSYEALWIKSDLVISSTINENAGNTEMNLIKIIGDSDNLSEAPQISIEVSPLPSNIAEIAKSIRKEDEIFYKVISDNATAILFSDPENTMRGIEIFQSPFKDWVIMPDGENSLILYTKPSGIVSGLAYSLNINNGLMDKILGNFYGLSVLPDNTGRYLIYSKSNAYGLEDIVVLDRKNNTSEIQTFINTLTEKCAWSRSNTTYVYCAVPKTVQNGVYPDSWYKGAVSFNDILMRIDLQDNKQNQILDPLKESEEEMDIIKLEEKAGFISFINKKDLSLWLLNLNSEN